jgi:hypothetical protein
MGILANSASVTMTSSSSDDTKAGYVVNEQVGLSTTPAGTTYSWGLAKPSGATSRSDLSGSTDAAPKFVPDAAGTWTVSCTVDGSTAYVLRVTVAAVTVTSVALAHRFPPVSDNSVPTPATGLTLYCSSDASNLLRTKGTSGAVTQIEPDDVGRTIFVDSVNGSDTTGARGRADLPFLTVTAALAATGITAGDVVFVRPGTYNEAAGLTMPTGVLLCGAGESAVTIARAATANATLLTMATSSRVEDLTLRLTSTGHFTLTGINFPGTTAVTAAHVRTTLTVDNSTASSGGTSAVTGVSVASTGTPPSNQDILRACQVTVATTGLGVKRGILKGSGAGTANLRDTGIVVTRAAGAGTDYIAAEVSQAASTLFLSACRLDSAAGADVAQTSGTLKLHSCSLINNTAGGLSFAADDSQRETWCAEGALPAAATNYLRPGSAAASSTEIKRRITRPTIVTSIQLRSMSAPGGGKTTTVTVRKNGVDTVVLASLANTATSNVSGNVSASFAIGDDLSVKEVTDAGNGTADLQTTIESY